MKNVLAIETSCDDTSVAIVSDGGVVRALCSANQDLAHQPFGGIVPEIASRNHTLNLLPLVDSCFQKANMDWQDIDGLAVTSRPGLMGSLLVGVVTAKTLALAKEKPFVTINHLEAHIWSPFIKDHSYSISEDFTPPFVSLVVSGGHTHLYRVKDLGKYEVLGATLDDAAGEAFDKFAKMLGLGFPGGVAVEKNSQGGRADAFSFPRALWNKDNCNFSFSGLKTEALRVLKDLPVDKRPIADLCASYQEAIVDVLVHKIDKAVEKTGLKRVAVAGGVSANKRLREKIEQWAQQKEVAVSIPPLRYCTDNAAMVGYVGLRRLQSGQRDSWEASPSASSLEGDFIDVRSG
ncbi:MAG: tRNA (adenosine(37)-N6)-threonylcarbamoyltransferase complex transferase subunit TsaD [Bdellovibrio sp.]|nr:MAG: tRNA (adenosine(37)-N6)-threonylcarbamoyltransferase complex transferase subunit TsaD [Bdellovibrio sp.]